MKETKYRGEVVKLYTPNKRAKIKPQRTPPPLPDMLYKAGVLSGDVAIDVGAYIGLWSHSLCKYYSQVVAIEPNPPAYAKMLQDSDKEKMLCIKAAASDKCTNGRLFNPKKRGTPTSMMVENDANGDIKVISLDSLQLQGKVGFIKIDVEGSEDKVLLGAEDIIGRYHPVIVVELCEERFGKKHVDEVKHILDGWGYKWLMSTGVDHAFL